MSATWSALVEAALGPAGPADGVRVERWSVRPGEVLARVADARGGHEVSLIRPLLAGPEWDRVGAALASQPVFRARLLSGGLPPAAARVFEVLGLDLVPRGWEGIVATCSCDHWGGRCAHVRTAAAVLGSEADRDPFTLTLWWGCGRDSLIARVGASSVEGGPGSAEGAGPGEGSGATGAAAFWAAPEPPGPPSLPREAGRRVRAAAPGSVADTLPVPGADTTPKGE
ncbi:hypothetical protein [Nocardiopsis sp. LOL_012]|uniref:SWIM zinc finger family protein n=1 Tax=Nocardiopsis sp. LOL_012 TaxID=3345409 RepID=UPI003A84B499